VRSHAEPARALHLLGLESRIRLTLPHFTVAPSILAATDLAVVIPRRPALRFAERHALQVVEPDLGLPPFEVAMHWTWRFHNDPATAGCAASRRACASRMSGRGPQRGRPSGRHTPGQHQRHHQQLLELRLEAVDDLLRVGHSFASVISPNCTPPPYDRMLTPTPMWPDCGTQNIVCRSVEPQNASPWPARHVRHDRGRLPCEHVQQRILRRLDEQPRHRQHREGEQRLIAALQLGHALALRRTRARPIRDADREHERHEAEAVAELPGLVQRAQVDRHHGAEAPCPRGRRHAGAADSPMAPATHASSTSLTEHPSALPTAFSSSSAIGSPHATRFCPIGRPFRIVGESSGISAIAATSLTTW
jgi:hypothetical protein